MTLGSNGSLHAEDFGLENRGWEIVVRYLLNVGTLRVHSIPGKSGGTG